MNIPASGSAVKAATNFRTDAIDFINNIPADWKLTPVEGKAPFTPQWEKNGLSGSGLLSKLADPRTTGFGLIFGSVSNGIIGIDHDGESVDEWIKENTGMNVSEALPRTVTVTSGRVGRYTKLYRVPEDKWDAIKTKSIKTGKKDPNTGKPEQIEFRWERSQSVVFGIHPDTKEYYRFWDGCEPTADIAPCPEWIYRLIQVAPGTVDSTRRNKEGCNTSLAKWCLDRIDPNTIPNFEEWRSIIFACHHERVDYSDVLEWCERYDDHNEAALQNVWKHIKGRGNNPNTIGTLYFIGLKTEAFTESEFLGQSPSKRKAGRPSFEEVNGNFSVNDFIENFDHSKIRFMHTKDGKTVRVVYTEECGMWGVYNSLSAIKTFYLAGLTSKDDLYGYKAKASDISMIDSALQDYHRKNDLTISELPERSTKYIGFKDGDYNTETNKLEEFSPEHNIWERWKLTYAEADYSTSIKDEYMDIFRFMTGNEEAAKIMYVAKCAEVLRQAKDVFQMVVVSGASRSGKTSYAASMSSLKSQLGKTVHICKSKAKYQERFGLSELTPNTLSMHVLEMQLNSRDDVEWIKEFIDNGIPMKVERKNENIWELERKFVMYASVQDNFKVESFTKDDAVINRFAHIKVILPTSAAMPKEQGGIDYTEDRSFYSIVDEYFYAGDKTLELFWYILQNETSKGISQRWKELMGGDYMMQQRQHTTRVNDPLSRFFDEFCTAFEIVDDPEVYICGEDKKMFSRMLKDYLTNETNLRKITSQSIQNAIANHMEVEHPELWEKLKPLVASKETCESFVNIDGKTTRAFRGIRAIRSLADLQNGF